MLVYLRDGSAQTIVRAATLKQKLQIKLSTSPSHSILTPGRPVPALTLYRQTPGRVATGVPVLKSLVPLDPVKSRRQLDSNPGSSAPEADALITRRARRSPAVSLADSSSRPTTGGRYKICQCVWIVLWLNWKCFCFFVYLILLASSFFKMQGWLYDKFIIQ